MSHCMVHHARPDPHVLFHICGQKTGDWYNLVRDFKKNCLTEMSGMNGVISRSSWGSAQLPTPHRKFLAAVESEHASGKPPPEHSDGGSFSVENFFRAYVQYCDTYDVSDRLSTRTHRTLRTLLRSDLPLPDADHSVLTRRVGHTRIHPLNSETLLNVPSEPPPSNSSRTYSSSRNA